ncbi:MAG: hypothetical protein ABH886_08040 [Candidatus Desantisbacteria bacterium]
MNSIKSTYTNYTDLCQEFGDSKIQSRYECLLQGMESFRKELDLSAKIFINKNILMHSILDYFSDISRLKKFHNIEYVNEIKIISYESFWLLKRKPIQVEDDDNENLLYINEKFVFSKIIHYLTEDNFGKILPDNERKAYDSFLKTFYYFLKFRNYDAQVFEIFILAFKAGRIFEK